jgi:hypothetical protein
MASAGLPEHIETYLRTVEDNLRSLPPEEVAEIARELRSHIRDRIAGDLSDANVSATLKKLGDPREIARINLRMREHAAGRKSPSTVLRAVAQRAAFSARGLLSLLFSLAGYAFAGCWLFTAVAKPFAPNRVGLWVLPDPTGELSLSLGRREADFAGYELLGWWIIPIGLGIGIACCAFIYRLNLRTIRKMATLRSAARRLTR